MVVDFNQYRFFLRPGATDLRKGINGLSLHIQNEMFQDPFDRLLFLFCNRQRRLLKIVYWDRNGFCLWLKKLEKDRFPWPDDEATAREIRFDQLKLLLDGIDFFNAHKALPYSRV